jgi:hypothetical protein
MTSKFTEPSTGQSFESKSSITDLSSLCAADPFAPLGESMAGGNTIASVGGKNGAPGTASEQSDGVTDRDVALGTSPVKVSEHKVGGK